MKTRMPLPRIITLFLAVLWCGSAQALTTLATFTGDNGAFPQANLIIAGGMLYGTASSGGAENSGTVFSISTNGGPVNTVYTFNSTGSTDGVNPTAGLVLAGKMLYGTTYAGGTSDDGTVFAVNTNGGSYSILYNFGGEFIGANPEAGLVLIGGTLYGTTFIGGSQGLGTVFAIGTNGNFTNLYSFTDGTDGAYPEASLIAIGNTLYGTTAGDGYSTFGTVFSISTTGSNFTTLYSFTNGTDGASPEASLVLSGNTLYGTTSGGGADGFGTVFAIGTNGRGFASYLFNFSNGANSQAGLILVGNTLCGTAVNGGLDGWGSVFQIATSGSNFISLYPFTDGTDGSSPEAALVLAGSTLYGTTAGQNGYGYGTIFSLPAPLVPIPINIALQSGKEVLTWGSAAFHLQSSTNVTAGYTNVTAATSPYTNTFTNKTRFFRLSN